MTKNHPPFNPFHPLTKLLIFTLVSLASSAVLAQDQTLTLVLHRTFGYGMGSEIEGNFRLEARGPVDLASVTFTIDDQTLETDTEAPFQTDFQTGSFDVGWHTLGATGTTAVGQVLTAETKRLEFVSPEQSWRGLWSVMGPILAIVGVILLVSFGVPFFHIFRGKPRPVPLGAPRRYGLAGGTICPKCGRPFSRHWWAFNLVTSKLDRCDHCGRWSLVRALPSEVLARAEAAELAADPSGQAGTQPAMSDAEKRQRDLEASRFE